MRAISSEALALLGHHRWPGNVRQLENAVFRAVVLAEGDSIGINEFPQIAAQISGEAAPAAPGFTEPMRAPAMFEAPPLLDFGAEVAPLNRVTHDALVLLDAHGDVRRLEEIEAECDPLCHRALSWTDVGGRPAAADRPLHALPQA